jgi:hypothetical protein
MDILPNAVDVTSTAIEGDRSDIEYLWNVAHSAAAEIGPSIPSLASLSQYPQSTEFEASRRFTSQELEPISHALIV